MRYRTMPKSKDKLSALGLGLMRLPQTKAGRIDEKKALAMLQYAAFTDEPVVLLNPVEGDHV